MEVINSAKLFCDNHSLYLNDDDCSRDKKIVSFKTFMSNDSIVDSYAVPSSYTEDRKVCSFVPEKHRSNIRSILRFFCDLHDNKLSLESFDESNIVFQRRVLKFRGLRVSQSLEDEDRVNDFTLLHTALVNLFKEYNKKELDIPTPIKHLLDDIYYFRDVERDYYAPIERILPNHLAILPHDKACGLIANFDAKKITRDQGNDEYYDSAVAEKQRRDYNSAVEEMERRDDYKIDWTKCFTPHSNPQAGPLRDCINHKFPTRKEGDKEFLYYVGVGSRRFVNGNILKCCRNNVLHLDKHMLKHVGPDVITSYKDYELITMAYFDKELLHFQLLTYKYGIADRFLTDDTPCVPAEELARGCSMPSSVEHGRQDNTPNSSTIQNPTIARGRRHPAS